MLGQENTLNTDVDLGGVFVAKVIQNLDPKAQERVRVRVIGVHSMSNEDENNSVWCVHCGPSKSRTGEIPDVGDYLYVMFINKSPMHPVWLGWARYTAG